MSRYIKEKADIQSSLFWKTGIAVIFLYLAAAFPGTTLFGSFPMQRVSLLLLLGHGAITIAFTIRQGFKLSKHMIWYGAFAALCFLSLAISGGKLDNSDIYSVAICFTLTVIHSFYIKSKAAFNSVCWCYVIVCIINTILLLASNSLVLRTGERLGDNLSINANVLALYFMYGTVYAIWLFFCENNRRMRLVLLCIIVFISYPLILTGGRKFFICPILFIIIVLLMNSDAGKKNHRMRNVCIIGVILLVSWILVMNVPALYSALGKRMEGLFNSFTGKGEVEESAQAREQLRKLAVWGWLDSPIWGNGFDTFKYYSYKNGMPLFYSHCNYTELLFSGGVILFAVYYWFFGMILWKCFTDKRIPIKQRSLCAAGILMQLMYDYGGVSYNEYHNQLFMYMLFCALIVIKNEDSHMAEESLLNHSDSHYLIK